MKIFPLTIAGLLLSTVAYAQPAPPPPAAPASRGVEAPPPPLDADAPPPPPPGRRGPRGDRPPPPPPGAFVHIDRGTDASLKLDVHCAERDSTKECADITTQLLEKLNSPVKPK